GGTPGPVEVEDPRVADEPSLRGETRARGHTLGGVDTNSSLRGFHATRSEKHDPGARLRRAVLPPHRKTNQGAGSVF
ncbi:MAG: hypothetical protein ACE5I5_01680, partial [Candidatus Heimdallarchaeota archaeon]